MSIYGRRKTALSFNGILGRPEGFEALHFMINLEIPVQVAGSFAGDFCDPASIPPSQIAQQGDGDIKLVLTVLNGVVSDVASLNAAATAAAKVSVITTQKAADALTASNLAAADLASRIVDAKANALAYAAAPSDSTYNALYSAFANLFAAQTTADDAAANLVLADATAATAAAAASDAAIIAAAAEASNIVDLSSATDLTILLQAPDLTARSFVASLVTNGLDGKMGYALSPADLAQVGFYSVQGNFTIAAAAKSTVIGQFRVGENIEVPEP